MSLALLKFISEQHPSLSGAKPKDKFADLENVLLKMNNESKICLSPDARSKRVDLSEYFNKEKIVDRNT